MKVIPPLVITDAILTSSSIAEPAAGEAIWVAATSYALGATVIRTTTHKIYQNILAGVDAGLPESTPLRWLEIGATAKWAMFDLLRNTQSSIATPLTVTLTPGKRINSVALLGLVADSVTVTVLVGAVVQYTKTTNLINRNTTTWLGYFFGEFINDTSAIMFDLPPVAGSTITVTISRAAGTVSCGSCVLGNYVNLGATEYNAESDALNFSTVTRDAFGNATLVPRRSIPKTTQTISIQKNSINKVIAVRELLNATPAVWSGLDDVTDGYFEALLVLGIYKQFTINLAFLDYAKINLQLEEI